MTLLEGADKDRVHHQSVRLRGAKATVTGEDCGESLRVEFGSGLNCIWYIYIRPITSRQQRMDRQKLVVFKVHARWMVLAWPGYPSGQWTVVGGGGGAKWFPGPKMIIIIRTAIKIGRKELIQMLIQKEGMLIKQMLLFVWMWVSFIRLTVVVAKIYSFVAIRRLVVLLHNLINWSPIILIIPGYKKNMLHG